MPAVERGGSDRPPLNRRVRVAILQAGHRFPVLAPFVRLLRNVASPASRGHRLRAVRKTVAYDVRTRWRKKPTVAPIGRHSKMICYPGETNSPLVAYLNPPNAMEMFVWEKHLQPGDLFVDVGSNIGIYTIFALDLGAEAIACEPHPATFARLQEHLELNGYEAEALNVAVSNEPGTLRLTEGLDSFNHLVFDGADGIEVEARTLDDIVGDRVVDGMKVDVEGAERLVLEGGRRAISEQRIRLLQLEWAGVRSSGTLGEDRGAIERILDEAGYEICRPDTHGNLTPVDPGYEAHGRDVFARPRR